MRHQRLGTNTNFTMSGSSQPTAAFSAQTYMIRVATATQPAYIDFGSAPVAANTDPLIGANCVDYITVTPGQKCAVLQAGTAGLISITELV